MLYHFPNESDTIHSGIYYVAIAENVNTFDQSGIHTIQINENNKPDWAINAYQNGVMWKALEANKYHFVGLFVALD